MNTTELLEAFIEGRAKLQEVKALPAEHQAALVQEALRVSASDDKPKAKASKKALYQLKSAGLSVPEAKAPQSDAPSVETKEEELRGILSPLIGNGERLLLVPRSIRGGGLEMIQAQYSDELGLVQLTVGELSRGQYRKQLKLMREGRGVGAMEISREEALKLLSHALWLNAQTGTPPPKDADSAVRHLGVAPAPFHQQLAAPQDGDATLAVDGHTLHDEPEVQAWLPPEEELSRLGEKMEEITNNKVLVDDAQRAEQLGRIFVQAAEAWFTKQRKQLYARRLWEMARYFDATKRARKAEIARAEARRLFHDAPGLFSPFAQRLFEKVLIMTQTLEKQGAMPKPPTMLGSR